VSLSEPDAPPDPSRGMGAEVPTGRDVPVEPWRARLDDGDLQGAWDLFLLRYRRLILAVVRRLVERHDVAEAYADVCSALAAANLARLRRYQWDSPRKARFSTWLVTVVHHLVVDRTRRETGRRRVAAPAGLTPVQQAIFTLVFVQQRSHSEAFEALRSGPSEPLSFSSFLKNLADTYRIVETSRSRGAMHYFRAPMPPASMGGNADAGVISEELARRVATALQELSVEEQAAIQLYVVDGMAAVDVARTLGLPTAKTVYNRAYRGLKRLRSLLQKDGFDPADL